MEPAKAVNRTPIKGETTPSTNARITPPALRESILQRNLQVSRIAAAVIARTASTLTRPTPTIAHLSRLAATENLGQEANQRNGRARHAKPGAKPGISCSTTAPVAVGMQPIASLAHHLLPQTRPRMDACVQQPAITICEKP